MADAAKPDVLGYFSQARSPKGSEVEKGVMQTGSMDVTVASRPDEIIALAADWSALSDEVATDFYASEQWSRLVLQETPCSFGDPVILAVRRDGKLLGIFALAIANRKFAGVRRRTLQWLSNLYAPRSRPLVMPSESVAVGMAAARFCRGQLADRWDVCELIDCCEGDAATEAFVQELARPLRAYGAAGHESFVVSSPSQSDPGQLFSSRSGNHKQNIRTAVNRICRQGRFEIRSITTADDDVDEAIRQYYDLLERSWKGSELYPTFHAALMRSVAASGHLRLFLLYAEPAAAPSKANAAQMISNGIPVQSGVVRDRRPVAAALLVDFQTEAHFLKTFYDDEAAANSAGALLIWAAFWHLFVRQGVGRVDFQRGKQWYKELWSSDLRVHRNWFIASPRSPFGIAYVVLRWARNSRAARALARLRSSRIAATSKKKNQMNTAV